MVHAVYPSVPPTLPSQSPGSRSSATADGDITNVVPGLLANAVSSWQQRAIAQVDPRLHPKQRWLTAVPDVGPACEILLADRLFHDLDQDERAGLLQWIRAHQSASGAWLDAQGNADLSLTTLAYWALAQAGEARTSEPMVRAVRVVQALGGAQRASFQVRLWLAMAGHISWDWLPALPSELFLVPPHLPLSPARFSPWARSMLTAYQIIARAPARLHLADASELLLRKSGEALIAPRLTRAGLAGDVLQAFDRTVKFARKLPRGPLPDLAQRRARSWIDETQQEHGGWFGIRPTLLSLIALRVMGAQSDDPRIRRGLDYLRRARGLARVQSGDGAGQVVIAQGLGMPLALLATALGPRPPLGQVPWLLRQELRSFGPWQWRADVPAGGWPIEPGANSHLDLESTCAVLGLLESVPVGDSSAAAAWAAGRRAGDVLLAMQQADGSFARFERGEAEVLMRKLPWSDADLLAYGRLGDSSHLRLTGLALARLASLGLRRDDNRIARGLEFCERTLTAEANQIPMSTLWAIAQAAGPLLPHPHPLHQELERRIRPRQREDGRFGDIVDTALALRSLLVLGPPCVQAERAARYLRDAIETDGEQIAYAQTSLTLGVGFSATLVDPSAAARESAAALEAFSKCSGDKTSPRAPRSKELLS